MSRGRLMVAGPAAALLGTVVAVGSGSEGTPEGDHTENARREAEANTSDARANVLAADADAPAATAEASRQNVDSVRAAQPEIAGANSPDDGSVAFRGSPSARSGSRPLQIPHGAEVRLGARTRSDVADRRAGSWCEAHYDGVRGYAFDAFLDRT